MTKKNKKKRSFPTAFTVIFIVLILAAILTYVIPAGEYATVSFNEDSQNFVISNPDGTTVEMEATQETLDQLGVKADLDKFLDGTLYKPMAISGTYVKLPQNGQGVVDVILSPIQGIYDSMDIILFVFMIGGTIGILNYMGAFNAGISALSRTFKGKEQVIITVVTFLISLGGTTFGMAEETIAFYPILIPIFLAAGYDAMVGIAAVYSGATIGQMFSTVNPFAVVLASNAAGVNFKSGLSFRIIGLAGALVITLIYILRYAKKVKADPANSIIYADKENIEKRFSTADPDAAPALTTRFKIVLTIFFLTFVVMIYGVSKLGWWFDEMSALFLCSGIIMGIIGGLKEKELVNEFVSGAADLTGVALIVGVARAVNMILENGQISDSILNAMSGIVAGMSPIIFIIVIMLLFVVLGFFVNSSSGLAVLSIPIMAPLADAVGLPREAVISAYIYGLGIITFITPTGLILASLEMVNVTYNKWIKFCMPLVGILTVFAGIMLVAQVYLG